jgi:hypothetical protein
MKKLAFCLALLGLGTLTMSGCAPEEGGDGTPPAATGTENGGEENGDAEAGDMDDEDSGTSEEKEADGE